MQVQIWAPPWEQDPKIQASPGITTRVDQKYTVKRNDWVKVEKVGERRDYVPHAGAVTVDYQCSPNFTQILSYCSRIHLSHLAFWYKTWVYLLKQHCLSTTSVILMQTDFSVRQTRLEYICLCSIVCRPHLSFFCRQILVSDK